MPGGVDMHCHIVGSKVNTARMMCPEHKPPGRAGPAHAPARTAARWGACPARSPPATGTPAWATRRPSTPPSPPLAARHAHDEFADTPCIDKGFFVLMGNNHYVMRAIQRGEPEKLRAFVGWLLGAAKGYAAKLVNPGGVEVWKQRQAGNVKDLDTPVDHFGVTPRQIIRSVARRSTSCACRIRCTSTRNNLGLPGNWTTTLETMKLLDGHRGHLTHIQFHSYGGGDGDEETFCSKVAPLAEYVNEHPNLTVDVGQVVFGRTTSMTADGPVGYYLSQLYRTKWFSSDIELEAGCGIVPIEYKNTSLVHAWQWAIGLEWYLLVNDPWRIAMSTDHPNGGSFLAYPQIIRLLMDRTYRQDVLETRPGRRARADRAQGPRPRILAVGDRHHHAGRPGPDARPEEQGTSRPRRRCRRHDLHARRESPRRCSSCRATSSRPAGSSSSRARSARSPAARRCTSRPSTTARSSPTSATGSRTSYSIRWRNYPVEDAIHPGSEVIA